MNIEARFIDKAPREIDNIERLRIEHNGMAIEITVTPLGFKVRLDEPVATRFAILPDASNTVVLSVRERK